jgi:hypothetical protein
MKIRRVKAGVTLFGEKVTDTLIYLKDYVQDAAALVILTAAAVLLKLSGVPNRSINDRDRNWILTGER